MTQIFTKQGRPNFPGASLPSQSDRYLNAGNTFGWIFYIYKGSLHVRKV